MLKVFSKQVYQVSFKIDVAWITQETSSALGEHLSPAIFIFFCIGLEIRTTEESNHHCHMSI
jgi:hypothetical protein